MDEQVTLFELDEALQINELILKSLREYATENDIPVEGIRCTKLKSAKTSSRFVFKFRDSVIARFYSGEKVKYIEVPNSAFVTGGGKQAFIKMNFTNVAELQLILGKINCSFANILDHLPKDFSCCSRYEICSDAGKCVHPDKEFSLGCFYRKNLRSGKVFYGANKK